MPRPLPKLIVILGPTASGKTDLAVKLAKEFNGEIINADSRQIYQEMNIGTAKPKIGTKAKNNTTYKGVVHHLINIVKPNENFTLAQYQQLAIETVRDIQTRKKTPILVGGTGLYIQSIIDNLKIPEVAPNEKIRKKLERLNNAQLLDKLKKLDPQTFRTIDENNRRRVIRALEVCMITHKPFSKLKRKGPPIFNALQLGIDVSREELYRRIEIRVRKMIKQGLEKEVKQLCKKFPFNLPSMSSIGYKEFEQYFNKKITLEEAIDTIQKNTRHYVKKQMTWFKKDTRIHWINNFQEAEKSIRNFLK